nr:MAG TPA: Insect kinin peptide [Caudoviricetes sp.]
MYNASPHPALRASFPSWGRLWKLALTGETP